LFGYALLVGAFSVSYLAYKAETFQLNAYKKKAIAAKAWDELPPSAILKANESGIRLRE
jgi:hypothetical protein